MSGRFSRANGRFTRVEASLAAANLDGERTSFAIGVLAHCTLDLRPPVRARFWGAYAQERAVETTGDRRLIDELGLRVARLAAHLQSHADSPPADDTLQQLRRRYDERAETELELDPSDATRMRLARDMVAAVGLTRIEEIAAALALAAQNGSPVPPTSPGAAVPLDEQDELELEASEDLSRIVGT